MRAHFSPLFFADLLSDLKKTEQLLFVYIFVFFLQKNHVARPTIACCSNNSIIDSSERLVCCF